MSKLTYNLFPLQELLILDSDSPAKIGRVLHFIETNRQKVETCVQFNDLVNLSIRQDEIYIKLYCIFLYMCRDSDFFDCICRKYNEYAQLKIRDKLNDIKLFILGERVSSFDENYNSKIQEREVWKYHLGVYIQRIQTYIMCL